MLKIPVFLCTDDNYAPYAASAMASILKHTKEFINFFVIDTGISKKNKRLIALQSKFFDNFSLEFIKIDPEKYFKNFPTLPFISSAMYGRYLIAELKPEINRAIYTDVDVIFTGDIKELYNESLDGFMLGAVPSQRGRLNNDYFEIKKSLNLNPEHKFFMSGLLLMDCVQWRRNHIFQKLMTETKRLSKQLICPDQEVLNVVFNNNYKSLDVRYCVIHKLFKDCYSKDEINEILKKQLIIHYPGGGDEKPWNNKKLISAEYFWDIVKYTNFENIIVRKYTVQRIKVFLHKLKNRLINFLKKAGKKLKYLLCF